MYDNNTFAGYIILSIIFWCSIFYWFSPYRENKYKEELAKTPPICLELKSGELVCGKQTKLRDYEQSLFRYIFQPDVYSYWIGVEGRGEVEIPKSAVALVLPYKKGE
jgi:hypothetical protein